MNGQATLSFEADDWAWLRNEARALDMSVGQFVRLLVRQTRKAEAPALVEDEPDVLAVTEIEIPPDPDEPSLDDLMGAPPSFLEEAEVAYVPPPRPKVAPRLMSTTARYAASPARGLLLPGSVTRAVGVNPNVAHGNITGDARGNVMRDNAAHFGFVGTRSR